MQGIEQKYKRFLDYLKNLLSDRQRHDLEKDMMQDVFENDAYDGLNQLSSADFEADMQILSDKLNNTIHPAKRRNINAFFRIAAGIALLGGIGFMLYFVFRTPSTNLLTREARTKESQEEEVPAMAKTPASKKSDVEITKPDTKKQAEKLENNPVLAENSPETISEMDESPEIYSENRISDEEFADRREISPAVSKTRSKSAVSEAETNRTLSGTVTDNEGVPLPGVHVLEKGTTNGAVTDENGMFALKIADTSSQLNLTYVGFKPLELSTDKMPEERIAMEEDLVSLNEVVVVGYSTQKKRDMAGAASGIESNRTSGEDLAENEMVYNPVPPGGSLKNFKKWVTDRLDYSMFKEYPGKQRILIYLTVKSNGAISDIRINDSIPAAFSLQFKKIIAQSPPWKPAYKDGTDVDTRVAIRFVLTIE